MKILKSFFIFLFLSVQAQAVSPTSIYNLKTSWTTQDDKVVEFSSLQGKVRIVSMVFTRCPSACPMLVGDIKIILSKLPPKLRGKVSVDIFSFDHQNDTPQTLRAFAKKMKIEDPVWTLYTSDKEAISEMAAVLGVQYKLLENGAYSHSNNIILVNKDGEILKTIEGYDTAADDFILQLKKTLAD